MKNIIFATLSILLAILLLCALNYKSDQEAQETWHNGMCNYCGGHYKLDDIRTVGREQVTVYYYRCDKCGHQIKLAQEP